MLFSFTHYCLFSLWFPSWKTNGTTKQLRLSISYPSRSLSGLSLPLNFFISWLTNLLTSLTMLSILRFSSEASHQASKEIKTLNPFNPIFPNLWIQSYYKSHGEIERKKKKESIKTKTNTGISFSPSICFHLLRFYILLFLCMCYFLWLKGCSAIVVCERWGSILYWMRVIVGGGLCYGFMCVKD